MVDAPGVLNDATAQELVSKLGVVPGMVVQELGWDEDADDRISEAVEDVIDDELLDYDTDELCDLVLLWWREDDGDLVDGLVDASRSLADDGTIWLLTPGAGRPGTLPPGEVNESAMLAGLLSTKAERFGNWQAAALVPRGRA